MKKLKLFIFILSIIFLLSYPAFAKDYNVLFFTGDEETNTTLDNTAAADGGVRGTQKLTTLTSTDHGFKAGSYIWINGTTNYDGLKKIQAVAANTITIYATFVAETPAGTETLTAAAYFKKDWELLGFRVHLNAASATAENLVVAIDSNTSSAYDTNLYTKDMNTLQDVIYNFDPPVKLNKKDVVTFTWANTNDKTWGIEVFYKLIP